MDRNKKYATTILLLVFSLACALPFTIQRTEDFIATAAEYTVQAYRTQTAPTATPVLPTATETPLPTATPWLTATSAPLPTATPRPCNRAAFISETVPDGTSYNSGQTFTKSWRLRNDGTCTWNPEYRLVFYSGDQMGASNSVKLNKYVKPGEQVDFLVDFKAPSKAGTYTSYWRLQADDGSRFAQVFTLIKVAAPFFAVTSVQISATPAAYSGICPVIVAVNAEITASTAGKVTYRWEVSDGVNTTTSELKSENFDKQDMKSVQLDLDLDSDGSYQVRVYIAQPNNQWFGPRQIEIDCN